MNRLFQPETAASSFSTAAGPLDRLRALLADFSVIPYENLTKIVKFARQGGTDPREILRLPGEVFEDHERYGLGGTCFSLTHALKSLLDPLGFSSSYITADMKTGRNVHCALIVKIGRVDYLADPGYLFSEPLALSHERRTSGASQKFTFARLDYREGRWNLLTFHPSAGMRWRYSFTDDPVTEEDFFRYWRDSFFAKSMNHLCISRVSENRQAFFAGDFMRVTTPQSKTNINVKRDPQKKIREVFGINEKIYFEAREALESLRSAKA
ncbi:MAG TPA: arylamine N-acetyltransferase [Candidatus Mcinerneyibacteriales bacterium]|nr:arylamine N-acetyltransferase [Candidatus Mcinerneyibacteriales bacterium]